MKVDQPNLTISEIILEEKKEILSVEELSNLALANQFLSSIPSYLVENIPNFIKLFQTIEVMEKKFCDHYVRDWINFKIILFLGDS